MHRSVNKLVLQVHMIRKNVIIKEGNFPNIERVKKKKITYDKKKERASQEINIYKICFI